MRNFKSKFFWKIYLFFFLNSLFITVLFVGIIGYNIFMRMHDFVSENEGYIYEMLVGSLGEYYEKHRSWDGLRDENFMSKALSFTILKPAGSDGQDYRPRPGKNLKHDDEHDDDDDDDDDDDHFKSFWGNWAPDNWGLMPGERPRKRPPWPDLGSRQMNFIQVIGIHSFAQGASRKHLALLDAHGKYLAGGKDLAHSPRMPIKVDGEIVGWFVHSSHGASFGLETLASKFIYWLAKLALVIFLVSGFIAYVLASLLLKPIRNLNLGLKEMAAKNFSYRIRTDGHEDELGQLAVRYNEMAESIESFIKGRKEWVSVISHELRTPLTVMRGEIESVQDGIRTMSPEWLENLHEETLNLTKLTEDIKTLSLADSEKFSMSFSVTHLQGFLAMASEHFDARAAKEGLEIVRDFEAGADVYASIDTFRIKQVVDNILENCLRYSTRPGQLRIAVGRRGDKAFFSVEDDGPGISAQDMDKIFERFYRVESSRNRSKGGSGLGLAICRSLVEAHSGQIWASQAPGGGLRINVELPEHKPGKAES